MPQLEEIEMSRYRGELVHDLRHLVKKYCRIMAWDVPDLNEERADRLIIQALHDALAEIGKDTQGC